MKITKSFKIAGAIALIAIMLFGNSCEKEEEEKCMECIAWDHENSSVLNYNQEFCGTDAELEAQEAKFRNYWESQGFWDIECNYK